jgi:hypothetical protein
VPVTTFTATDNSGSVAGYMLTESATQPPATDAGWLAAAPADHTFASAGTKTLYAWAKDAAGNVSNSLSDTVTITIATIPIAPTGLTARSISSGTINLAWIDTSTNETGFEVWRKAGANAFALLATTAADAKSYSDATAASNTTTTGYVYYIKACNAEGCSQTKNAVVPFSPATLKATATGSAANLTWADKSANETAFLLERNVGACGAVTGTWTQIKSLSANTISYSDATVTGGTTYAYRIRAKAKSALTPYAVGYSFYSNCASVAVPNTTGGSIQLPETGQTTCYNEAGAEIACAGTGQDGELQMGVAWLNPRFVSGTGAEADCMIDTLTGLMWPKNGNLAGAVTWQGALDYVRNSINTVNLCGYSDWRIPSVIELESLVNAQQANSAEWLNGQRFSNVQSNYYWSSTTYSRNTSSAWVVGIVMGDMVYGSKADIYYAWPVRGGTGGALADIWVSGQKICYNTSGSVSACTGTGQDGDLQPGTAWPTPRFADNGDGTVTDKLTGLVWLKNANCYDRTMSWNEALFSVNSLSNGQCGLSDGSTAGTWRVPNRKELLSLMNFAYYSPSLSNLVGTGKWSQGDPFDNVVLSRYWSSSTNANITNDAWEADMIDGVLNYGWFKTHGYYVWPVRSGQ